MLVTFDYWLSFGKGDSGEAYIDVEITEEEYERLKEAQEICYDFDECEAVADIYNRIYELAEEDATRDLRAEGILKDDQRASDLYPIGVNYPWFGEEEEE